MAKSHPRGRSVLGVVAVGVSLMAGGPVAVPSRAGDGAPVKVSFLCKVVPVHQELSTWLIELRRSTGELAGISTNLSGSKVNFKDLDPGIYTICITGTHDRRQCESVDLTPPAGKTSYRFSKSFQPPARVLGAEDSHTVSQSSLSVPQEARDELIKAERAQIRGDIKEAEKHLLQALEIDPSYADALNNLGTYYHRERRYEDALRCFQKVTDMEPGYYGGWVNMGGSLIVLGRFQEALEANKRAFSLRPDSGLVVSQLALSYFYLHDLENARKYFLQVLAKDPESPVMPQLYLLHISLADRDRAGAAAYIKDFLRVHPNGPEADHLRETLANIDTIQFYTPVAQVRQLNQ